VSASTVALAALLLSGCARSSAPAASGDSHELSGTLTVLAAASLTEAFGELEERFERDHPGVDVVVGYGGSSTLAAQVVSGAPADVFAAASSTTMATVSDAGLVVGASEVFARNTLMLAVPVGDPAGIEGIADLADPGLLLALCAPEVPCGAAAVNLLQTAGIEASADTLEEDVKAVLTKVELGEVDAGLVYVTDVRAAGDRVEGIRIPDADAAATDYPIAVLRDAPNPDAARAWVHLVLSETGAAVLADEGFASP
jgi:molybdate transport system substrate-binding protein